MSTPGGQSRFFLPLGYLLVGVAWIVGSDYVLGESTSVPSVAHLVASLKGVLFVVATAALLFVVQAPRHGSSSSTRLPAQLGGGVLRPYLIFSITCAGVLLAGLMLYGQQAREVQQRAENTLESTAVATAHQVEGWIDGLRVKLDLAGRDPLLAHAIVNRGSYDRVAGRPDVRGGLDVLRQSEGFERVQVFSPTGEPIEHAGQAIALSDQLRFWARGASSTGRVVMSDLYVPIDSVDGGPVLDFVVTLMHDSQPNGVAGILVARADPSRRLYRMFSGVVDAAPEVALTLARRESDAVAVLLPAQHSPGGAATYERRIVAPGTALHLAASAQPGVFTAPDEQGHTVFAAGHEIAGTPWTLVATVSENMVFAAHRRVGRLGLLLVLSGLVVSGWLVAAWWGSERRAMAAQLDAADRRNTLLKEHFAIAGRFVHDIVLLLDNVDGTIVEANDRALDAYGYSRAELLARTIFEMRPAGSAEQLRAKERFEEMRKTGGGSFITRHWRKDGSSFPVEVSARYCELDGRQYVQMVGRDITERLESEERLAALSAERDRVLERLQRQFDHMATACIVLSAEGDVMQINPAHERVFGYGPAHVVGRNVREFVQNREFLGLIDDWLEVLRRDPDATLSGVFDNVTLAGRQITCRWSATALRDDGGGFDGLIGMAEDITEQVVAERALRNSEERYRSLTEISPVGIFRTDLSGQVLFVNSRCSAIVGLSVEECMGMGWARAVHPNDARPTARLWQDYIGSKGSLYYAPEFRIARSDGRIVWVLAQIAPEMSLDGQVQAHIGTITDITALKEAQLELRHARDHLEDRVVERTAELEQAKNAAEHSDRVKSAFLSTMSHELRTPLNSILGFTDVLLQGLSGPLTEPQQRQLQIVRDSAAHLRSLIEDVLDISRIEAGQIGLEFADIDMHELVARRAEAFGPEYARKGIALQVRVPDALPTIRGDRKRTDQIINNLLSNALKFTDTGGVSVEIRRVPEYLELRVIDTGVGIPASALSKLFNPFTQVVRPGGRMHEGTGLGLAISRNLARALGGDVTVESELGRGSCFTLRLPLVAREPDHGGTSTTLSRADIRRALAAS
jgi:PAS domain S-box-containing protein